MEKAWDNWSAEGLELTEQTVLTAAEAFQAAFRELNEKGDSTAGAVKSAFKDGDTFFVSQAPPTISEALNRYARVKHNNLGNTYGL